VRNIGAAQSYHSVTDEEGKYAKNLLTLNEASLFVSELPDTGRQDGYEFKTSGDDDAFTVNADPMLPDETGIRHFFADETGVIRWSMEGPATVFSPPLGETEPDAE